MESGQFNLWSLEQFNSVLPQGLGFFPFSVALSSVCRLCPHVSFLIAAIWLLLLHRDICHRAWARFYMAILGVLPIAPFSDMGRNVIWEVNMGGKTMKLIFEEVLMQYWTFV